MRESKGEREGRKGGKEQIHDIVVTYVFIATQFTHTIDNIHVYLCWYMYILSMHAHTHTHTHTHGHA